MPPRPRPNPARRHPKNPGCTKAPPSTSGTSPSGTTHAATPPRTTRVARRATSHPPAAPYRTADISFAVWACAQKTGQWQRYRRYLPQSNRHPAKMLPALARHAIHAYSDPGDLILDPMCGIGTTPVEAIHLNRHAIGVELEPRWSKLATANITHAQTQGATAPAHIIQGDARHLPQILAAHTTRRPDVILTSPPYACQIADLDTKNLLAGTGSLRREDTTNYSPNRQNLGHARGSRYTTAMNDVYQACATVLKPGGYLILVTKDMRANGSLRNLSGETITLCENLGLQYHQRIIGLLATIREDQLVMRPSFWQTLHARHARKRGERTHIVAHEDILVFHKPTARAAGAAKGC
jgi:modification methylase